MRLIDCFIIDARQRGETFSFKEWVYRLLFSLPYKVLIKYRLSVYFRTSSLPRIIRNIISNLFLYQLSKSPGVEINTKNEIGYGLFITHPHDIVIGAGVKIATNVTIYNGVTLGAKKLIIEDENQEVGSRYPEIGNNVTIFTGAKIIGPVKIGDNCTIGANAVVINSFPANSIIAGIPARLTSTKK